MASLTIKNLTEKILETFKEKLGEETARAEAEEAELLAKIEAIVINQNVVDIVANFTALENFPTTGLEENDKIIVVADETKTDSPTTVYTWNGSAWGNNPFVLAQDSYNKTYIDNLIASLTKAKVGEAGKYIRDIKQDDGLITANEASFDTDFNNPTDNTAPTTLAAKTYTDSEINKLNVPETGTDGSYIKKISETNGKISTTLQTFDNEINANADDNNAPTTLAAKTYTDNAIESLADSLDLAQVGDTATASYVKMVKQDNGKVSAEAGVFDNSIPNSNPSQITAPTTKAVKDYTDAEKARAQGAEQALGQRIDGLDFTQVGGSGKFIKTVSQTDGQVSATAENFITQINDETPDSTIPPTEDAIVDYVEEIEEGLQTQITENAGDIDDLERDLASEVENREAAINALDMANLAVGAGETIKNISEDNGVVSAEKQSIQIKKNQVTDLNTDLAGITNRLDTIEGKIPSEATTANKLADKAYVNGVVNALDYSETVADDETVATITQTDGQIGITVQKIQIPQSKVIGLDGRIEDIEEVIPNEATTSNQLADKTYVGATIDSKINALDVNEVSFDANETVDKISETDGKISTTKKKILIAESQVTDLVSDLNSKFDKAGGTVEGNLTVQGDLIVNGTEQIVSQAHLAIEDKVIEVAVHNTQPFTSMAGILANNYDGENSGGIFFDANGVGYIGDLNNATLYEVIDFDDPSTTETYAPNTYYYQITTNKYVLDDSATRVSGRTYYKRTFENINQSDNPELLAIAARSDSSAWTNGHLAEWDATHVKFVDSGKTISDFEAAGAAAIVQDNLDTHTSNTNNPHNVTATQVGLGNLTNDKQIKGLSSGTTENDILVFGADGYTIKDSGKQFKTSVDATKDTEVPTSKAVASYVSDNNGVTSIVAGTGLSGGTITRTGTISLDTAYGDIKNPYGSKTKNYVLASPNGSNGVPIFRALVADDIPALNYQAPLAAQTVYTAKGSATKVPQITTNSLGQVTSITEVTITDNNDNQKIKAGSVTFGVNDVVDIVAGSNVTVTGDATTKKITISSSYNNYYQTPDYDSGLKISTGTGVKALYVPIAGSALGAVKSSTTGITAGRDYNVQINSDGTMKVNVPWTDNNTTYTAGTGLTLSNTEFSVSTANASTILNLLTEGTSVPSDNDYYISQYVNGGTSTTTFHRRPTIKLYEYVKSKTDNIYTTGPASSTANHIATFDGTTGKLLKDSGYTIATSVPANAVFTDTNQTIKVGSTTFGGNAAVKLVAGTNVGSIVANTSNNTITINTTWRGIQDNLTSDSTTDSLSAKQGKLLANGDARDSTKLPLSGGTITGTTNFNSNTNTTPLIISRNGSNQNEFLSIGVDDSTVNFIHTQDETTANFVFKGQYTDTESGGGAKAGSHTFLMKSESGGASMWIDNDYVIHSGNIGSQSVNYATSAGSATSADNVNYLNITNRLGKGANKLQYLQYSGASDNPTNDWYSHIVMHHENNLGYFTELAACFHSNEIYFRRQARGTTYDWTRIALSGEAQPASDVYAWAKASTKPSYTASEVGALPLSGGKMTGTLKFTENMQSMLLRDNPSYYSGIGYATAGNEAVMFENINPVTSWIFRTNNPGSSGSTWDNITPSMQIKNQRVTINKLIANGADADYNLDVNGTCGIRDTLTLIKNGVTTTLGSQNAGFFHFETTAPKFYFNKEIYVDGAIKNYSTGYGINSDGSGNFATVSVASKATLQYNSSEDCLDFIFN